MYKLINLQSKIKTIKFNKILSDRQGRNERIVFGGVQSLEILNDAHPQIQNACYVLVDQTI